MPKKKNRKCPFFTKERMENVIYVKERMEKALFRKDIKKNDRLEKPILQTVLEKDNEKCPF